MKLQVLYSDLNLREGPGTGHDVIGVLQKGAVVYGEARSHDNGWWMIARPKPGWASAKYLKPIIERSEPPWMALARSEIGVSEIPGPGDNPRVAWYLASTNLGKADAANDETPWCAGFANRMIEESGYAGTDSAWARDFLRWGVPISAPVYGCVTVFSRPPGPGGHVAFFDSYGPPGYINVLGGNQSDAVNIKAYPVARVLGYRMAPSLVP